VTRILALKRVEAVDPSKKPKCETSARSADASYVNQRFEATLSEVEAKCAAGRASREDFQRLRNLVVLNGRAASRSSEAPSASSQGAMLAAIDRAEKRSAQGQDAKDDFLALREACTAGPTLPPAKPAAARRIHRAAGCIETGDASTSETAKPTLARRPPTAVPPTSAPPSTTPAPTGPAASRQRAAPPPPPPAPKPPPRPPPQRPATDPSERSKP
jgi:hypothetical protein